MGGKKRRPARATVVEPVKLPIVSPSLWSTEKVRVTFTVWGAARSRDEQSQPRSAPETLRRRPSSTSVCSVHRQRSLSRCSPVPLVSERRKVLGGGFCCEIPEIPRCGEANSGVLPLGSCGFPCGILVDSFGMAGSPGDSAHCPPPPPPAQQRARLCVRKNTCRLRRARQRRQR